MTVRDPTITPLAISLFGPIAVQVNGAPLPRLRWRRGEAILALLGLRHDCPVERAWLAGLFWPDGAERQGLATLRRYLNELRRALGPEACRLHSPTPSSLTLDLAGATVAITYWRPAPCSPRPSCRPARTCGSWRPAGRRSV
jgi:DNA-binding SARP family transcriptional activator